MNDEQVKIVESALAFIGEADIVLNSCLQVTDDPEEAVNELEDLVSVLQDKIQELETTMS